MNNKSIIPVSEPTSTSTNVTMEMITGSVEKNDDGVIKVNYFVKFTTGNGHHILYPWEGLKSTVLQWMFIEEKNKNVECDHQDEQCSCICHEPYKLIIHDHSCCSPCFTCGFKEKCKCKNCSPKKPSNICPG